MKKKDVSYFPNLWKGDPPMAPINPGYIQHAKLLKQVLMNSTQVQKCDTNFQVFRIRVDRLWVAVCRENYIFSFKNTLEVIAYNELDAKFSEWSWTFHRKMVKWQLETANCINNSSSNEDALKQTVAKCLKMVDVMLATTFTEVSNEMEHFLKLMSKEKHLNSGKDDTK